VLYHKGGTLISNVTFQLQIVLFLITFRFEQNAYCEFERQGVLKFRYLCHPIGLQTYIIFRDASKRINANNFLVIRGKNMFGFHDYFCAVFRGFHDNLYAMYTYLRL
jgi:hypothetical protein